MERVLMTKANYLADKLDYEVYIVTAEQQNRKNFFSFSPKIRFIDLEVNYHLADRYNLVVRFIIKYFKSRTHKRRLRQVLLQIRPDISISMFDKEFSFLCKIKDGSKKILEYHFSKNTKLFEATNKLVFLLQWVRIVLWKTIIQRYDSFVVLTEEDKISWGKFNNIVVIPNSIPRIPMRQADLSQKRVCSIGRISYQKGFDLLLQSWQIVYRQYPEWSLCIIGGGDAKELREQIQKLGLYDSVDLKPPTTEISKEYLNSSIYAMSSRYEGFGMVLIEAMSYGLPVVSFACPCGPQDIIDGNFGSLVPPNDIRGFAEQLMYWMEDEGRRKMAGVKAKESVKRFLENEVMKKWVKLFESLI